ncbi:MAG TPA: dTDP-4-dehydrorhamnose reductase [Vicinamibacterales bacterium]|nr:dTDP-4-dehydrorhamnose reductase [Vicinamibacterales bacterium]
MQLLLTGARGLLGAAIAETFGRVADIRAFDRRALDITDADAVTAVFADVHPDVVVNCAAYNDVDGAEDDPQTALRVNAFAVRTLARASAAAGAVFVHYSTDFVFDGQTDRPYVEEDEPNPRSVYASSKLLGDWFAAETPRHYVLRVESLFGGPGAAAGSRGRSLGTIVDRLRAGEEVPVFVDRTVSPSYVPDIADATLTLVQRGAPAGLYHCVNTGAATWEAVALEAARLLGVQPRLRGVSVDSVKLRARRPRYCALSNAKLASAGFSMPTWQDALARYLK